MNQPGDKQWVCDVCCKIGDSHTDVQEYKFISKNIDSGTEIKKTYHLHGNCWYKLFYNEK